MEAGGNGNIVPILDAFGTIGKVVAVETFDISDTEESCLVDFNSTESVLVSVKDTLV